MPLVISSGSKGGRIAGSLEALSGWRDLVRSVAGARATWQAEAEANREAPKCVPRWQRIGSAELLRSRRRLHRCRRTTPPGPKRPRSARGPHARGVIPCSPEGVLEEQLAISIQKRATRKYWNASPEDASLCALVARSGLIAMLAIGGSKIALSQTKPGGDVRPAVGGVVSLPDAALIYPAQGAPGACGENCSNWLAAEGTVHWDGHTRFTAGLDRFADRKRPIFLNVRGQSDLNVAMSVGRLLRKRGYDVAVGQTIADQCRGLNESDCVALKRSGVSLPASLSSIGTCDLAAFSSWLVGCTAPCRRTPKLSSRAPR
jgi:hypothetical protein